MTSVLRRPLVAVKTSDSQSRESRFESSHCLFEAWTISFTPHCCITEYLATGSGGDIRMISLHALIAMWLSASQRRRVGVGMNMSARGEV